MLLANINGVRVEPSPKGIGLCPICGCEVYSKCGEINVWHWAHKVGDSCDSWHEKETKWHLNWKLTFGEENIEVIIEKENKKHIADILTNENVVIELQNSPIQKPIIRQRELFYGEKMLWIINGSEFKHNFEFNKKGLANYSAIPNRNLTEAEIKITAHNYNLFNFKWKKPKRSWEEAKRPVFIDFGDENLYKVIQGIGNNFGQVSQIHKSKFIMKYGGNYEYYQKQNVFLNPIISNSPYTNYLTYHF
ncbi:MAG: competence protein CoiA family protein [Bacteroidota bacterium]|nr:competence protein CoiA family protein [Bacteroidota bacterium]